MIEEQAIQAESDEPAIAGSVNRYIDQFWRGQDDDVFTEDDEAESRRIAAADKAAAVRFAEQQQQRRQAEAMRREAAPLNGNRGFSLLKV